MNNDENEIFNEEKASYKSLLYVNSDIDEYGLDPYEFRLYAHIVRRTGGSLKGKFYASLSKTAKTCKMSVRKAQYAFRVLCDAGLIRQDKNQGRTNTYRLNPTQEWVDKQKLGKIREQSKKSSSSK